MTIQIDDGGYGDILFGVVIGAYRPEKDLFYYDLIDVKYWQEPLFEKKVYKREARRIALKLLERMNPIDEVIEVCQGNILDQAAEAIIEEYPDKRIDRCMIEDRAQYLVELAYINELRNLGYEPIKNRTSNWVKNFWDMYHWVEEKPDERLRWTKSGMPNLKRYKLFR
ncbi:MAG: hypothetical protein ACLFVP_06970 [Candidatus Bathyarchaeia archaeon]